MQELAMLPFLAKASQPMLTHQRVQPTRRPRAAVVSCQLRVGDMAFVTARAIGAVTSIEGAADGPVRRQTDLFLAAEEGGEAEVVGLGGVVEDVGGELSGGGGRCGHGGGVRELPVLVRLTV